MAEEFSLSIEHLSDRSIVSCSGALDPLPAEKLREAVEAAVDAGTPRLVVDCSAVTLLTSAGITALVDTAIRCKELGIALDFELSKQVRRVLDLVGLWWLGVIDDGIAVHSSLQRALRSFADQAFAGGLYDVAVWSDSPEDPSGEVPLGT